MDDFDSISTTYNNNRPAFARGHTAVQLFWGKDQVLGFRAAGDQVGWRPRGDPLLSGSSFHHATAVCAQTQTL